MECVQRSPIPGPISLSLCCTPSPSDTDSLSSFIINNTEGLASFASRLHCMAHAGHCPISLFPLPTLDKPHCYAFVLDRLLYTWLLLKYLKMPFSYHSCGGGGQVTPLLPTSATRWRGCRWLQYPRTAWGASWWRLSPNVPGLPVQLTVEPIEYGLVFPLRALRLSDHCPSFRPQAFTFRRGCRVERGFRFEKYQDNCDCLILQHRALPAFLRALLSKNWNYIQNLFAK